MGQRREVWRWLSVMCGLIVVGTLVSCNSTGGNNNGGGGNQGAILKRASKSGTIAITGDDKYVVQVNPENDSVTTFRVATNEKVSEVKVGKEPFSVVIAPDDQTAFVANREDGTVMKLSGINGAAASVVATVNVGSEPTGLALTPSGAKLVVTEFAEGRVSLIDTATMQVTASKPMRNPRAVAISNNGDADDSNDRVIVTEFYGQASGEEAKDDSRSGVVRILNTGNLGDVATVLFPAIAPGAFVPTATGPNQLSSVNIIGDKFYVTATGASPDGVPKFNENVFPLVLVGDVTGNKLGTISLADAIKAQVTVAPKNFMADMIDVAFVGNIGYFLGRGADEIQRATFTSDSSVTLGSSAAGVQQIDLLGGKCQNPIGVVTPHDVAKSNKMFVNCWVSRNTAVVNLDQQKVETALAATTLPVGLEATVNKGRRFYFTGRGRWSNESWSSCASCHPDGLSDNITWRFPSGPRQATSMDSTFSHGPGAQKERILNWSAIFDELHDFERNTRGVSGGKGAVTTGTCGGDLSGETAIGLNPADATDPNGLKVNLGKPVKEVQDETPSCVKDFDDIDEFVKTIRPAQAKRFSDAASVSRGRTVFTDGKCQNCHGGAGWTVSRRFYTPAAKTNADLALLDFTSAGHTKAIQAEQVNGAPVVPAQVACVLRVVNSFGVPGNAALTGTLEKKQGGADLAQGSVSGYNVPGLYGLAVGAPFLHHGQVKTLEELFSDPKWLPHLTSGSAVFNNGAVLSGQKLGDLVNFLTSIDANTPEEAIPSGQNLDKCPSTFP
jgi:DNA-binding beta-propeller fold protein YncE